MSKKENRIDWLNHALEFFVVVVGILMAFQLENNDAIKVNFALHS